MHRSRQEWKDKCIRDFEHPTRRSYRASRHGLLTLKMGPLGCPQNVGKQLPKIFCVNTAEVRKHREKSNRGWKDDIKMDAKGIRYCGMDWMTTAQEFLQ
jgi:hypothetical protein